MSSTTKGTPANNPTHNPTHNPYQRGVWIGVLCDVGTVELDRMAMFMDGANMGEIGADVARFLRRCSDTMRGTLVNSVDGHPLLESDGEAQAITTKDVVDIVSGGTTRLARIEQRALEEMEERRHKANVDALHIFGDLTASMTAEEADNFIHKTMSKLGCRGFNAGRVAYKPHSTTGPMDIRREAGVDTAKNYKDAERVRKSRNTKKSRKRSERYKNDPVSNAGITKRDSSNRRILDSRGREVPDSIASTLARDSKYAKMFESWAGVRLRDLGFKMNTIENMLGIDRKAIWRHMSGFTRHWKARNLDGHTFTPPQDWVDRLQIILNNYVGDGRSHKKGNRLLDKEPKGAGKGEYSDVIEGTGGTVTNEELKEIQSRGRTKTRREYYEIEKAKRAKGDG